ncbi:uncharacterized protein [Fopius arisanus]|uniref:EBNA1BP2 protein n=1 Tax=Fopius arisanus TaxID=64838 RepID=A0A0C9QU94_9HYME|nr:PREDICTED: uncharacterized protein LOC105271465 [Fopius arisanus]
MSNRKLVNFSVYRNSFRCLSQESNGANLKKFSAKRIAFESDYYYKQNKELRELLKRKTQEELQKMQNKVRSMQRQIKEYNRDIDETLRFLENLEKGVASKEKKT